MEHDWFNAAYDRDTPLVRGGQGRDDCTVMSGAVVASAVALAAGVLAALTFGLS